MKNKFISLYVNNIRPPHNLYGERDRERERERERERDRERRKENAVIIT